MATYNVPNEHNGIIDDVNLNIKNKEAELFQKKKARLAYLVEQKLQDIDDTEATLKDLREQLNTLLTMKIENVQLPTPILTSSQYNTISNSSYFGGCPIVTYNKSGFKSIG